MLGLVASLLAVACAAPSPKDCPGHFDPSGFSEPELRRNGIGNIPERGSTTQVSVRWAVENRASWIKENYPDVVSVDVGRGWGVTYSNDRFGKTSYHRAPDHMIVTVVATREACPDPDRGQLMVIGREAKRVPVRFVYRP